MIRQVCTCLCLLAISLLGCGGGADNVDKLETVPASGKVTLDGSPFGPGTLDFIPLTQEGDRVRSASARVNDDGTFTIGTYDDSDGIVPGDYRVEVSVPLESATPAPNVENLEFTVSDGGATDLKIDLISKKGNAGTLMSPDLNSGGASTAL